jgi:2-methylcitrate dehydratase PrpD
VVVRGNAGYASFTEAMVHDRTIAALRRRVHITEDSQFTAAAPQLKPARVTVTLKDGRQATRICESPRGDFQRPYQEDEVRAKFRELAGLVLPRAGVGDVERAVDQCDRLNSVRALLEQVRRHSRS